MKHSHIINHYATPGEATSIFIGSGDEIEIGYDMSFSEDDSVGIGVAHFSFDENAEIQNTTRLVEAVERRKKEAVI